MELVELNKKAYEAVGWKGSSNVSIQYDNIEVGDVWIYIDINDNMFKNPKKPLKREFDRCDMLIHQVFKEASKKIEFFEDDERKQIATVKLI